MIYVANLQNLFWTNGSVKKPNNYPAQELFTPLENHFITWTEQQITGWIQLEGEWNYLIYNGLFYFLEKSQVANEGTAWIYAVTKDFWCCLLKAGCKVKGTLNATNNEEIILENLDLVKSLVEEPAKLYRVNFEPDQDDWKSELQILRWTNPDKITEYIGLEDWSRFYSQIKAAKRPRDESKRSAVFPIVIANLKATSQSTYKRRVLNKINELLAHIEDYFPGQTTTLGNQVSVFGNYCLTTEKGRIGTNPGGLTKHKEYIKIRVLDFSNLFDIRPIKIIDLDLKLTTKPFTSVALEEKPEEKIYRELAPKTFLPYFKNWKEAFLLPTYKGRYSQVLFSESTQGTKATLDYVPVLNFMVTNKPAFSSISPKGRLGIQIFDTLDQSAKLRAETTKTELDFITGLREGWDTSVNDESVNVVPLELRDRSKRLYASIWKQGYRCYLENNCNIPEFPSILPNSFLQKVLTTRVPLTTPIEKGDFYFTSQQYTWIENDEADTSGGYINAGKLPPKTSRDESYLTGVVALYDPKSKKYAFYNITKQDIPLQLEKEENDIKGVTFPDSEEYDPDTSEVIQYDKNATFTNTLYICKRLFNTTKKKLEKEEWKKEIKKYPFLVERLKRLIREVYEVFTASGGFANNGSVKNSILGKEWGYLEPDLLDDYNLLWSIVTDLKNNGQYNRLCNDTLGLIKWQTSFVFSNRTARITTAISPLAGLGILASQYFSDSLSCGFKFNKARKILVIAPYWDRYDAWFNEVNRALLAIKNVTAVGEDWDDPADMAETIKGTSWPASILESIGKGHFSGEQFLQYEEDRSGFQTNELEFYDLQGTNFILVLDRADVPHLIFKLPIGIEERSDREYRLAHHEIPQTTVDIISQKNVLSVYNQNFDINDRFIWRKLDWRISGKIPSLNIRRFKPSNRLSPFEEMIVSYYDPKTVIDGPIRIAKEEVNWTNFDPIQAERLKLEISKWKDEFDERKVVTKKEIERSYMSHGERIAANVVDMGTSVIGLAGAASSGLDLGKVLEASKRLGNSVLSSIKLQRDIDLETRQLSYKSFKLEHEYLFKHQEYKLALFQASSTQNLAPINDRTIINEYCEYFDVEPVYIRHFVPSEVQKKLAQEMFELFGADCLIPEVELNLAPNMSPCFYRFTQVLGFWNVFESRERDFITILLENGVRIIGDVKLEPEKPVQPLSWQEQYALLMQNSTEQQWEIVLRTSINKLPGEKAIRVLEEKFHNEKEILDSLIAAGKDKKALAREIQSKLPDELVYEALEEANKVRPVLRKAIAEYLVWTVNEMMEIPNIDDFLVTRSKGRLVKKSVMDNKVKLVENLCNERFNGMYNLPAKLINLFYRPILEKIKRVYVKTEVNSRFGDNYGKKDVVILEYANTNKIFEPLEGRPGWAYCSWGLHIPTANREWQLSKYTYPYNKITWYPDESFEQIKTKMTDPNEYDFVTDPTKALVLVDNPKNMVVMLGGRVVDLARPNKTLHWDTVEHDFVWRDVDRDPRYKPIQYVQDIQKALSLELFGVQKK